VIEESLTFLKNEKAIEVMGGEGVYWLAGSIGGYFQRRYINPRGGDRLVARRWGKARAESLRRPATG